jgi:hypothetical protein
MIAGPFQSHTFSGRTYKCDAEDDVTITIGGRQNEVVPNGDGTTRVKQTRLVGTMEGINLVCDPATDDMNYLLELQEKGEPFDYSGTTNDGTIWTGKIQISDRPKLSHKEGTMEVTLVGDFEIQG